MARGFGKALQTVLAAEGPGDDLEVEGPSLANARRRQLFRFLCLRPCARVGDIAESLSISHATVRWHERDLLENGYLDLDGLWIYPRGLIDPQDAGMFHLLAAPGRGELLGVCVANPGATLIELAEGVGRTRQSASKIAAELSDTGLVTLAEDGRFRRHYATDLLARKREANRSRAKAFGELLVRRLDEDGLEPQLLRSDAATVIVRFGTASRHVVLDVPLDPYATAWQHGH